MENWTVMNFWPIVHPRDCLQVGQNLESITEVHHLLFLPWKGSSHLLNCTHLARSQGHVSHFLMVFEESFFHQKGEGEMVKRWQSTGDLSSSSDLTFPCARIFYKWRGWKTTPPRFGRDTHGFGKDADFIQNRSIQCDTLQRHCPF